MRPDGRKRTMNAAVRSIAVGSETHVKSDRYLLGHEDAELQRLENQARVIGPATRAILQLAGIAGGMRVLDLGTGAGDVAFDVAEIVGPSGSVVGIDQSPEALARARRRAAERNILNVEFVEGDLATVDVNGTFDAVVGRLVLLYAPDPALIVKRFASLVRTGGVVVAMEFDMNGAGSVPRHEQSDEVVSWIAGAFSHAGLDPSLGARLGDVMTRGGLPSPSVLGIQPYLEPGDPAGGRMVAGIVSTLQPVIVQAGLATEADIDIDTLAARTTDIHVATGSLFKPPTLVGCWATIP